MAAGPAEGGTAGGGVYSWGGGYTVSEISYKYKNVTAISYLGYLIQAKPPLTLELMFRLTLDHSYHSFKALSTVSHSK